MRAKQTNEGTTLRLSENDTYDWAHTTGAAWPCSTLSGKRLRIELDAKGDLVDIVVNGRSLSIESNIDGHEFNACIADQLRAKFGEDHPGTRDRLT